MRKQNDVNDTSLFFRSEADTKTAVVEEPSQISTNEIGETLSHIMTVLESVNIRVSSLEGGQASGISRDSLTYADDVKFYNWLKSSYRDRIFRKNFFDQDYIVGEPCWDMILDLCISEIEGRKISVTSACLASGVPITTALRWISLLERDGLIEKESDSKDRRRTFLRISKTGFERTFRYFKSIAMRPS